MINNLTPEQINQIPVYREKWRTLALSTERINRPPATEAVNNLYLYGNIGIEPPTIMLFDSPYGALLTIAFDNGLTNPLVKQFKNNFFNPLLRELKGQISSNSYKILIDRLKNSLEKQLKSQLQAQIQKGLAARFRTEITEKSQYQKILDVIASQCFLPELLACWGSLFDFARTELNCNLDEPKWLAFQSIVNSCGWIFPFGDTVLICDRPTQISFNDKGILHAEGEPAISFVDDYRVYAYNGVILPVEYGVLPPSKWESKWLLKNHSIELKKALIKGIGKTRIKEELTKEELKIVAGEQAEYIKQQRAKQQKLQQSVLATAFFENITPEQESRIEEFDKKWQAIAFNKPNKYQAEQAVKKAYAISNKKNLNPTVVFCANPAESLPTIINDESWKNIIKQLGIDLINKDDFILREAAINELNRQNLGMQTINSFVLKNDFENIVNPILDSIEVYSPLADLGEQMELKIGSQVSLKSKEKFFASLPGMNSKLKTNFERNIYHPYVETIKKRLETVLNHQVGKKLEKKLGTKIKNLLFSQLINICEEQLEKKLYDKFADLGKYYQLGAWFDFCISVLGCECDAEMWSAFQELAANCCWIYAKDNICVVAEVSLNYRVKVKAREENVSVLLQARKTGKKGKVSLQKPSMPLWKQVLVKISLVVFGLPLLSFYLLVPLARLIVKILNFLIDVMGFLLLLAFIVPIKIGGIIAGLLIGIFGPFGARNNTVLQTTILQPARRVVHTEADSEGLLHAEGKPAVIFDDGTKRYFHHGVRLLNRRYWVHPRRWRPKWLLTESDPDMFDILIEEIGYVKVCKKLKTRRLDRWREYSLLEFRDLRDPSDRLLIHVLKMTCPSTGSVHVLRVPPEITTAREAVGWVNWGTDPEEFVVET